MTRVKNKAVLSKYVLFVSCVLLLACVRLVLIAHVSAMSGCRKQKKISFSRESLDGTPHSQLWEGKREGARGGKKGGGKEGEKEKGGGKRERRRRDLCIE